MSGADPIDARPGFAAMLKRIEGNGVRTIIVETASRFARDLMVQEVGYAAAGARHRADRGRQPAVLHRRHADGAAGAPGARGHRRVRQGDDGCEAAGRAGAQARDGREGRGAQEPCRGAARGVAVAKRLRRRRPKGGVRSFREISAELFGAGSREHEGPAVLGVVDQEHAARDFGMTVADVISAEVVIRRVPASACEARAQASGGAAASDAARAGGARRRRLAGLLPLEPRRRGERRVLLADLRLDSFADALGCVQYGKIPTGFPSPGPGF